MRRVGGALLGLALALAAAGPAAAQHWPGYGDYGYGAGYDYPRNVYSYPRMTGAQSPSVPADSVTMYGGYMPNTYYSGAAYLPERGQVFYSGQAYCQTAGSFLYCADIESGMASLMSAGRDSDERTMLGPLPLRQPSSSVYGGVLATRTVGQLTSLVGTLASNDGTQVEVSCSGPLRGANAQLTCR
jgi:hypothetical protein